MINLMKTTSMIALIAVISAVSIGTISMNGFSAIPLVTASVSPESGTIMGHVEYILRDADGNIKSYIQGDNQVVDKGDDCIIGYAFQSTAAGGSDTCTTAGRSGFQFIGIGNATHSVAHGDLTLVDANALTVADTTNDGLMAVRFDNNTVATASNDGGSVVIDTPTSFTFDANNATTVRTAGLFDGTCNGIAGSTLGYCTTNTGVMNMFSSQAITVAVASGDSLSVTWTITVGNNS
jgi:hypothetical protein